MSSGTSIRNILISAATFILLEVAALAILSKSSALANIWVNRASHRTMAALWGSIESVRNTFRLSAENDALLEQNVKISAELDKYKLLDKQAAESNAMPAQVNDAFVYIPATIVKLSKNSAHNYIILNKGSEDGVEPDCGIISNKGVVGIVKAVDKHYSYGLTLMNTNVGIGGRIKGKDYLAPVVWDNRTTNGAILKDLPLHHVVNPGDTVVTSGFSTIFPPDVPIGVTGESIIVDGSVFNTDITLFQDFVSIKYVTVAKNIERDEIEALEAKGEGIDENQ